VARTAVVAGTATAVSNRVSRRQANRWSQQEAAQYAEPQYAPQPQYYEPPPPPPAPAPAAAPESDTVSQLQQLAQLRAQGLLNEAEFEAAKAKILGT
jgi:hypothetical protein